MKVQFIKSACVLIENQGIRVLCDPWLLDGTYYGSWYHYPPLRFQPEDFGDVDYIYISHIHPDHLDVATLQRLPRTIPILIHDYADKFVLMILQKMGFKTIHEIGHHQVFNLGSNFTIEIHAADNCDPALCSKYFECSFPQPYEKTKQIDSLGVFHGDGKTIVNVNDCPYELAVGVCNAIVAKYQTIDFVLFGYSGAGPYPQCFDNLDDEAKKRESLVHRDKMLGRGMLFLRHLRPLSFMPFAGQYTLGGKLAPLNRFKSPPLDAELPTLLPQFLHAYSIPGRLVLLNSGEFFDIDTQSESAPFLPAEPADLQKYIDEVLAYKKLIYEKEEYIPPEKWEDLTPRLELAHERMLKRRPPVSHITTDWNVYLDTGQGFLYHIPLDDRSVSKAKIGEELEPFLRITLDYSLLMMILERKAHWNNAEIGSHLRYFRNPNIFHRSIQFFMSYFHC